MLTRRSFLASGPALLAASRSSATVLRPSFADDRQQDSLRGFAVRRQLLYGAATSNFQLQQDDFADAMARECAILVPEYELKRDAVEAVRGYYDFGATDKLLRFARSHGLALRGHPLVWHASNPDWLEEAIRSSRDESLLTRYVEAVASHYRGAMHSWDVVNEAIAPDDGRADGLRDSFWLRAFGPTYVDIAFHAARAADPQALLVYNDWGCEAGPGKGDRYRRATLKFLESARARNVPIDAFGMQGHLGAFRPQPEQGKLRSFLEEVAAMGLRILVTEHDVDDSGGPSEPALRDGAVADASRRFLDVVLDNRATVAVLTWGLSDRFLKSDSLRARLTGFSPRMLPLDGTLQRKTMWRSMARAFGADL